MPCIGQFSSQFSTQPLLIDIHSHFIKQSYRNRCQIYGANGALDLIVPVQAGKSAIAYKEVKVSYDHPWQNQHFRAIRSAYGGSPYYEYYIDYFQPIFSNSYHYLLDLNVELINILNKIYKLNQPLVFSESYEQVQHLIDFSDVFHPKKMVEVKFPEYTQVFSPKYRFKPNLSMLDYLFNQGSNTAYFKSMAMNII
jgi:hypothetical protein